MEFENDFILFWAEACAVLGNRHVFAKSTEKVLDAMFVASVADDSEQRKFAFVF